MGPSAHLDRTSGPNCPVASSLRLQPFLPWIHPEPAELTPFVVVLPIESISPSVMIPPRRLAVLLDQVKQNQIARCLYHNTTASPSLYADHRCDRIQFPLHVALELDQHQDEVWILRFSPDGSRLATGGRDRRIIVYDVPSFAVVHTLVDQPEGIADLSWSPDSSKLLSCTYRNAAFLWDANVRGFLLSLQCSPGRE